MGFPLGVLNALEQFVELKIHNILNECILGGNGATNYKDRGGNSMC